MPTNNQSMQQRFAEVAAHSGCEQVVRILGAMILSPTSKVYGKQREARKERWQQLYDYARSQVNALSVEPAKAPTKRRKATARDAIAALDPGVPGVGITEAAAQ